MPDYQCIIIDEEQDTIELLSNRIQELRGNIEIVAVAESCKAPRTLCNQPTDFDFSMPEKGGLNSRQLAPTLNTE